MKLSIMHYFNVSRKIGVSAVNDLDGIWLPSSEEDTRCAKELGTARQMASALVVAQTLCATLLCTRDTTADGEGLVYPVGDLGPGVEYKCLRIWRSSDWLGKK